MYLQIELYIPLLKILAKEHWLWNQQNQENIRNFIQNQIVSSTNKLEKKKKMENLSIKKLKRYSNQLKCRDLSFMFWRICEKQKRERHRDSFWDNQLRQVKYFHNYCLFLFRCDDDIAVISLKTKTQAYL